MEDFGTAIILAGGKSTRMGFDKQFLEINKKRLIDIIISKLEKEFEEIIIITNKPDAYGEYPQKIFTDKIKNMGPLAGIYTGISEAAFKYSFITACDMPNINLEYIHYMKKILKEYSPDICITKIGDNVEPFHGFYSKDIVEDIEKYLLMGKRDIKGLTKELNTYYVGECYARKYNPNLSTFENLNTQEDLKGGRKC